MREDYISQSIFTASVLVVVGVVLGAVLAVGLGQLFVESAIFSRSGLWFWGAFLSLQVASFFSSRKLRLKYVELLESMDIGALLWLSIVVLPIFWPASAVGIVLFGLFYFFESKYRNISWYKSGRVGFSGFSVLTLFFLFRLVVALMAPDMIIFVGKVDVVLSAAAAFLFAFSVYNLAQKQ